MMKMIAVALWWIVFFDENDGLDEDDMDIIESHNSSHLYTPEQRQENFFLEWKNWKKKYLKSKNTQNS